MKYLKNFKLLKTESKSQKDIEQQFLDELAEFCELNLAYLLDNARLLIVLGLNNTRGVKIEFNKPIHWDDIQDDFIPFFYKLKNTFYLKGYNNPKTSNLIEMYTLNIDGDKEDRYYNIESNSFKNCLGDNTRYNKINIDDILIYSIKINLERVYSEFE